MTPPLRGKPAGASRATYSRFEQSNTALARLITFCERHVPRRVGLAFTVLILLGSLGLGVVKGEHVDEVAKVFDDLRNSAAKAVGFNIATVTLNGKMQLSQEEILDVAGITDRSSLLFLDAGEVRERLKSYPWIAEAHVLKFFPDRLQLDITERVAFALWQQDGQLSVISDEGIVLEPYVSRRYASLPLVVGVGADKAARNFLELLKRYPQVQQATRAAIYVGERRWNLRLKDGIDVRLPEHDVGNALAMLSKLDKEERLFSRDIVGIDMRLPDRLTVRLSEDAAKARDEQLKDKKPKKKAGDA